MDTSYIARRSKGSLKKRHTGFVDQYHGFLRLGIFTGNAGGQTKEGGSGMKELTIINEQQVLGKHFCHIWNAGRTFVSGKGRGGMD